ncbi:hypothetical protein HYU12_03200, partial [Candidatus Woesearchaeota archaeon]|nr:hypothetical protein [Candidatus Woesearchaeota archaeon]
MQPIIATVTLLAMAAASYTDLKKREVADWINYGLAAFGIGAAALASIAFNEW